MTIGHRHILDFLNKESEAVLYWFAFFSVQGRAITQQRGGSSSFSLSEAK